MVRDGRSEASAGGACVAWSDVDAGLALTARREDRVGLWEAVAHGVSTDDAAVEAGVCVIRGWARWFCQAGGMRPISLAPVSGGYPSSAVARQFEGPPVRASPRSVETSTMRRCHVRDTSKYDPEFRGASDLSGSRGSPGARQGL